MAAAGGRARSSLPLPAHRGVGIKGSIGPIHSGEDGLQGRSNPPGRSDRTCGRGIGAQWTVMLTKVDMTVETMSSRSM